MKAENRPVLSISLLTNGKKQEETIKCFKSLNTIGNRISTEIVVVDTGCPADFRKTVEEYADKVIEFEWCDDFAKARNAGLKECIGEWFMFVDDDEWFENTDAIVRFFNSGEYKNYGWGKYLIKNYLNSEGTESDDFWAVRLSARTSELHFEGMIHEYMTPLLGEYKLINSFEHHYGYVFQNKADQYAKSVRNIKPLLKMIEKDSYGLLWRVQLIQEYEVINNYEALAELCQSTIDMFADVDAPAVNQYRSDLYVGKMIADNGMHQYETTVDDFNDFRKDKRNNSLCNANLYFYVTDAYMERKDYRYAATYCKKYLEIYDSWKISGDIEERLDKEAGLTTNRIFTDRYKEVMVARLISALVNNSDYDETVKYIKRVDWDSNISGYLGPVCEAVTDLFIKGKMRSTFVDCANAMLASDESRNFAIYYARKTEKDEPEDFDKLIQVYGRTTGCDDCFILYMKHRYYDTLGDLKHIDDISHNLFTSVIDIFNLDSSVWNIIIKRDVDLGSIMDDIPFGKWKLATDSYFDEHGKDERDKTELILDAVGKYDGVKVSYFFLKAEESNIASADDPVTGAAKLKEYSEDCLNFYKEIYRQELFEGDMTVLPPQCRFAKKFTDILDDHSAKPVEIMQRLEDCKDIYAPFNPSLGEFIKIYGEQTKEKLLDKSDRIKIKNATGKVEQVLELMKQVVASYIKTGDKVLRAGIDDQRRQIDRLLIESTENRHYSFMDELQKKNLSDTDWLKETETVLQLINITKDLTDDVNYTAAIEDSLRDICNTHEFLKRNYDYCYLHAMHLKNYLYGCPTIIVGSSHAMNGILESKLEGGTAENINFSISSQDIYDDFLHVKMAVENGARPIKTCVINFGYYMMYQDLSKSTTMNYLIPSVYYKLFGDEGLHHYTGSTEYDLASGIDYDIEEFNDKSFTQNATRLTDDFFRKQSTYYGTVRTRENISMMGVNKIIWNTLSDQQKDNAAYKRCADHNRLFEHKKSHGENVRLINEMTKYLTDRGIRTVYLIMPFTQKYNKYINPEYKQDIEQVLNDMPYPVEYLDMNDLKDTFTDEDFIDTDHLNIKGAEKATKLLRTFLQEQNS